MANDVKAYNGRWRYYSRFRFNRYGKTQHSFTNAKWRFSARTYNAINNFPSFRTDSSIHNNYLLDQPEKTFKPTGRFYAGVKALILTLPIILICIGMFRYLNGSADNFTFETLLRATRTLSIPMIPYSGLPYLDTGILPINFILNLPYGLVRVIIFIVNAMIAVINFVSWLLTLLSF